MRLFLKPNDTFFFRDGRPFNRGQQAEGYSIETPLPSTVMGALRTAYIAFCGGMTQFINENEEMKSVIGTKHSLEDASVHIKGVFLGCSDGSLYYPTPRDLVSEKKSQDTKLYPLSIESRSNTFYSSFASELPAFLTWKKSEVQVEHAGGYVSSDNLRKYLLSETQCLTSEKSDFIIDEPKIGITREYKTLTAAEGMLYRINMKRFKDSEFGFVVDVNGIDQLPKSALIKLGGEGKGFSYSKTCHALNLLSEDDLKILRDRIRALRKFKIYLAAPAIFDEGWFPSDIPKGVELIAAAVGNYVSIGGWDVAHNRPKSTYRSVPAGSVYYFQLISDADVDEILDYLFNKDTGLDNKNIGSQRTQEGFGLAYVGAVSKE